MSVASFYLGVSTGPAHTQLPEDAIKHRPGRRALGRESVNAVFHIFLELFTRQVFSAASIPEPAPFLTRCELLDDVRLDPLFVGAHLS